MVGSMIAAGI